MGGSLGRYIDSFFRPFYGGITLNRELTTSARVLRFTLRMLASGHTVVPALGMGEIPRQLASHLREGEIQLNSPVDGLLHDGERVVGVRSVGKEHEGDAVVVATEAPAAGALTGEAVPERSVGEVCLYYETDGLGTGKKILVNAEDGAFVNNAVEMSNISEKYAPPDRHLLYAVALTGMDLPDEEPLPQGHRGPESLVSPGGLQAARAPPHPLRSVRPAAWHSQQAAREQDADAGARARWRVHRGFVHKRFHALRREGCWGGDRVRANGTPALKIEKLRKTYSNGFLALDGVSLEVEAGKFFGLLGPNGAGKTTLINGVVSLARPDSGSVEVFGKDAYREFREARRMIGVSPQEVNLDKFLTVEETLLFHAGYYGVPRRKARERAEELLERFELTGKRGQRTNTLSGGLKRRVLFARALMHDPKVLFLDEPTAGVDVELRYKLWGYIRELNRGGMTILLTTHYLEEAEALCEEIALINGGSIAAQGSSDELKERYEARNVEEVYMKVIGHDLH